MEFEGGLFRDHAGGLALLDLIRQHLKETGACWQWKPLRKNKHLM